MIFLIASLLGAFMGVILARIIAEFVLIVFRINEHLGAIRNQGTAQEASRELELIGLQFAKRKCMTSPSCHDVVLAFEPHLAGVARAGLAAVSDIIVVGDGFGTDEAVLEIGVDDAGRLRRLGAAR